MNIVALIATLNLNYFAIQDKQTRKFLAPAVTMALSVYSHHSLPFLKALQGSLPRLGGIPLVAHAPPQVVPPAKCSSPG